MNNFVEKSGVRAFTRPTDGARVTEDRISGRKLLLVTGRGVLLLFG